MAKTQEELNQLKTEYETLNNKLKELTDDELKLVVGGNGPYTMGCSSCYYTEHWGVINRTDEIFDCPKCGAHTFKFVSWQGAELTTTPRGLVSSKN